MAEFPFLDPSLPIAERVDDLISRMTLAEKVSQTLNAAPAIERLGVPAYDWWNECLHGVGRAGIATVFPQAIGMGATWDIPLMAQVATAISDEARAKHHEALRHDNHERYTGLTYWSPNVNIFRDPRWGRGQETYGEDPYLTARLGVTFIKGLQGDDPKYLKLVATPKHYAVHSGPEADRHHFNALASERDMRETYLPHFEACIRDGKAVSIMGAYNRTNGEACCASKTLLQDILRDEWGFDGYVVSDCGAIRDIHMYHHLVETPAEAAALAVNAGCDLNCGQTYAALQDAVAQGLISEATLDTTLRRLFTARFRLGMFDPPEIVPYAQIPFEVNDSEPHRLLALQMARESIVLLKNEGSMLPLSPSTKTIAVIGPNADDVPALLGNYNGVPSKAVTPLQGIRAHVREGSEVLYARGCDVVDPSTADIAEAIQVAKKADVAILVLGLSQAIEGEEKQREGVVGGRSRGDREDLDLPGGQEALLGAVYATGTPVVLVLINGSAVAVNWAQAHVPAIIEAWYPGEEGGTAVADVLFGDYNPGGRLPLTFYKSVDQLPAFTDYNMEGHTYRYFRGEPLYPFGFGLSYTSFTYGKLAIEPAEAQVGDEVEVSVEVTNAGPRKGDEVVQCYLADRKASWPTPIRSLKGFERVTLLPGQTQTVRFTLQAKDMSLIDDDGRRVIEPGEFEVSVGGCQPDYDQLVAGSTQVLGGRFRLRGRRGRSCLSQVAE